MGRKHLSRYYCNTGIADAKIFDNNGNEIKLTNKQKEKYVAEHFAKQSYTETVVEDADKLNPSEFNQELVKTSNNPIELFTPMVAKLSSWEANNN